MTQKDESPNASEGPYWSEELLAVLVVGLGDETQAHGNRAPAMRGSAEGPCRFQMAETTCQPQFEAPHHLEWLIRRPSASSAWARMHFFPGRPVRSWRRVW